MAWPVSAVMYHIWTFCDLQFLSYKHAQDGQTDKVQCVMQPQREGHVMKITTSTPVIWTGIDPHMPIVDHRETQIVYNTGRHRASGSVLLTPHAVHSCTASLSHRDNDRRTCYRFFNFWPWVAYPWAKSHQKGDEMTYYPPRSTILQNFSPITQTVYEICVTKFFTFWLRWANSWAKVYQKGRWMTWWTTRSTTLQNFIALRQPTLEISVTKILQTKNKKDKQ